MVNAVPVQIPDLPTDLPYSLLTVCRVYRAGKLHHYDDNLECYLDLPTKLQYSWLTAFRVYKAGHLHHYWMLLNTLTTYTCEDLPWHHVYHVISMG